MIDPRSAKDLDKSGIRAHGSKILEEEKTKKPVEECFARSIRSSQERYRFEEEEDPKTKHEDYHGDVTVLGKKERRMLQRIY